MQREIGRVGTNTVTRGMQVALFIAALAWAAAANTVAIRAAQGIAVRFRMGAGEQLLEGLFLTFLAVVGFRALDWISTRGRYAGDGLPLPLRRGWRTEWAVGAAVGWGICLAATIPVLLSGNLHARLSWQTGSFQALALSLATLLVATLAEEVIFRGYPFRRLIEAIGPSAAAVLLSLIFAVVIVLANPPANFLLALLDTTLFGLVLAMAWLRSHGLWVGWGLHFAYRAVMAVVLGLPVAGHGEFGSPVDMYASGPRWLTGGAFGLDAAALTGIAMLGAMAVLFRTTRDYAWEYTFTPIVPAGYEVTVAPPAAHAAMENEAPATPVLVQILPSTSQTRSAVELPPQ